MKYDILEPLKDHLQTYLTPQTAKKYYASAVKLFRSDVNIDVVNWSEDDIKIRLDCIRGKNEFSAAKNALLHMKEIYPDFKIPDEKYFHEQSLKRKNRSKKQKDICLDSTKRKINQISDPRLKYAYRLALCSGLRVSELAAVEAKDIYFREDGIIEVTVTHGKGGSNGIVICERDDYLYSKLGEYVKNHQEGPMFYSSNTLQKRANELGIECHDLRRIFAITTRNKLKQNMPIEEANAIVQGKLRHARFSTTKRYLFNRKLKFKEKK